MKTLLLMRHAKSSWKQNDLKDHERPLSKRGKKDAPTMGKLLREKALVPQRILCSSAVRARTTAEAVMEACHYKGGIEYLDSFYLTEPHVYLDELKKLPEELECVMIIAHNPSLEGLLQILNHRVESLTTAAIAHLVLPIDTWQEINEDTEGKLTRLWRPRELKEKSKK